MAEEEVYVLTPWGCLMGVLMDYGIDISHITPKMGEHIADDFLKSMVKAGHIGEVCEEHED